MVESKKHKLKIVLFAFLIMGALCLTFMLMNFFLCKSLLYFSVTFSLLVTELVIVLPELKRKDRKAKKMMELLGFGFIGAFIWLVTMVAGISYYYSGDNAPINIYKPHKHKSANHTVIS